MDRGQHGPWGDFTVRLAGRKTQAHPRGVPQERVTRTYSVHILYRGGEVTTVPLEVGWDEIGGIDAAARHIPAGFDTYLRKVGQPDQGAVATFPATIRSPRRSMPARLLVIAVATTGRTISWTSSYP